MSYIRPLDTVGRNDIDVAGGKGANLGELVRAGLPVPPGFIVTTEAYRAYVQANGLSEQVLDLATGPEPDAAADQIRPLFTNGVIPDPLRAEVTAAYRALGQPPVAVRSSATAEDLADASFAGQQDTYLNVRGEDALLSAVQRCWASLWTARAIAYRARQGIDPSDRQPSRSLSRRWSTPTPPGCMFTANPTSGRRQEAVIAAAWGLGESVVGGTVNTDHLVVDKADGRITRAPHRRQGRDDELRGQGTAEGDVRPPSAESPCWTTRRPPS